MSNTAQRFNQALLVASVLAGPYAHAQNERNIWYFGQFAGLDFNGGDPVVLSDGQLTTSEGCASIADANGDLLFYTDGITVWGRDHVMMPNGFGLMGGESSTQSGVIVPKPGSSHLYYIFTVGQEADPNGLRYSEVDMDLNGGNGDVTAVKNIHLAAPTCEKIAAVQHANGTDIWVITHQYDSDRFISFLVSAGGINPTPVESAVGLSIDPPVQNTIGQLRASQDGTRLAAAHWYLNAFQVFDFNKATGVVSAPLSLTGFVDPGPYGVEFSPNGRFLYVGEAGGTSNIYQFDLEAGSEAEVDASQVVIHTINGIGGELQLAPDGRIYVAWYGATALDVIRQPDLAGLACQYVPAGQTLGGASSGLGLPTFIDSRAVLSIVATGFCPGDSTFFSIEPADGVDSVEWDLGDPGSGSLNEPDEPSPAHLYPGSGTYEVTAIVLSEGLTDTLHLTVTIVTAPGPFLGPDTALCPGMSMTLDETGLASEYLWSTGSDSTTTVIGDPGSYWLSITINGCVFADTIAVLPGQTPTPSLGPDLLLCTNETAVLSSGYANAQYAWSDDSDAPTLTVTEAGTYWVEVALNGCSGSDSVEVAYSSCNPIIEMPNVFSPDGSGLNDLWLPLIIQDVSDISSTIHNRWGQKVYSASGVPRWNGHGESGEAVPDGVYFWVVSFKGPHGEPLEQHGHVTVLNSKR